jgi:azurin
VDSVLNAGTGIARGETQLRFSAFTGRQNFSMKTKLFPTALAVAVIAVSASFAAPAKDVVIVANDQMKFSVTRIEAQPGQALHVTLKNEGTLPREVMGHNWILLRTGSDITAYAAAALSAAKDNYQPKALAGEVLASIPLLGAKHDGDVTFNAPGTPGTYVFLCTFPAHFQAGMRGELIVK